MPGWLNRFKKNPSVDPVPTLKTSLDPKEKRCPQCGDVLDIGYGYTNVNVYCEKCREKNIREWEEKHSPKILS